MTVISQASDIIPAAADSSADPRGPAPVPAVAQHDPSVIFNAFDALQSQTAVLGHDGKILYVNEAWRQFGLQNGYAGDDLGVGRSYLDHADVSIVDETGNEFNVRTALEKVLNGVSSGFYGEYVSDSPRERRYFSVYAGPYVAGDEIGAVVVHTNITSRRSAMAELEAEREILQSIAAGGPLDEILHDLTKTFENLLFGSQCAIAAVLPEIASFQSVTGTPRAARVFDSISRLTLARRIHLTGDLCAQSDVLDLASLGEVCGEAGSKVANELAATSGMLLTIRGMDKRPIGLVAMLGRTIFTMSVTESALIQRLCAVAGIAILSARSRTALKQSEERYALAFEGANDGLWDWDMRNNEVFRSARCYEILGYKSDSENASRMDNVGWWIAQIHPDDLAATSAIVEKCLEDGESAFAMEYRMRRADNSYCWISDRGAVIRDAEGRACRAAGSITDISPRKLAEQQRRALEEQLRQTQKSEALGTLAGGIAHDINNTLVPILGTVDLMLYDASDEQMTESLKDIQNAATKIRDLVRQILAFSRNGGSERSEIDLVAEVGVALRMLRSMVPTTISLDFDPRIERFDAAVNQTQLHQVIMNLVSNAASAIGSNKGAVRISVDEIEVNDARKTAEQHVSAGKFCRISIVDSGSGIAPDVMARLFDPFFTTKGVGKGTGLGLSVVQGIVREHHGFIEVSNEPGAGAKFDVHFPSC
ncbi:ATP-binding protein [Dongia deserti]|uniref:ATP-binding protein n=1 Tax=Dongia deserti TaxID=2268030 RepID=UPI000E65B36A|nr:ATP-binding protein [Dongia deserti]